jgi:hypothetical protein
MTTTIEGVAMTEAAAQCVEETGISPSDDVDVLRARLHTDRARSAVRNLLDRCLDGADADRVQGWRDYVDAIEAAAKVSS